MSLSDTELYECLKEAYDEVLRRRTFLSDRASTLIGFDGVAAAILTGFIAANRVSTSLLLPICLSLIFYLGSTLSAILAIWETEWYLVPSVSEVVDSMPKDTPTRIPKVSTSGLILQVIKATELNEPENWRKYSWLRRGYLCLALAVTLSTIIGALAIMTHPHFPWR